MTIRLNFPIDSINVEISKELIALFETFDLVQHVTGLTPNQGLVLNLDISKDLCVPPVNAKNLALSDRFCVFFDGLAVL